MITHSQVLEIIALPMLVYDYSKSFKLDKNQTIEGFLGSTTEVLEKLTPTRQEVLKNIKEYAPYGEVIEFISDEDTDLQVAITISKKTKRISIVLDTLGQSPPVSSPSIVCKGKYLEKPIRF